MPITANGQTYSDDQIKNFFASNPTADSVAKGAAQLGLSKEQIAQAMQIGGVYGGDINHINSDINSYVSQPNSNYSFDSNGIIKAAQQSASQQPIGPGMYAGGKWYTQKQIQDGLSSGGSIAQWAQQNGITDLGQIHDLYAQAQQVAGAGYAQTGSAALQNAFKQYQRYSPNGKYAGDFNGWLGDLSPTTRTAIEAGMYSGQLGATAMSDFEPGGIYGPGSSYYGQRGYGSGLGPRGMGDLGGGYDSNGAAVGSSASAPNGAASGGIIGGAQSAGSSGGTTMSGSTQPGTWTVDSNQLVRDQFGNLIDPNSPLMQKARTQALERMGERGLINSSLATTAADSAMYDAALGIAKQDASTYADAAKTNAGAKTSWAIAQNNNATSMANNAASIAAQKELTQAKQLYNNLANQTASATTIQTWGLNTISSIMASDLSADAKNAAIAQIKTWMSDSYSIQGDWHTSAAKAIDAVFGG